MCVTPWVMLTDLWHHLKKYVIEWAKLALRTGDLYGDSVRDQERIEKDIYLECELENLGQNNLKSFAGINIFLAKILG